MTREASGTNPTTPDLTVSAIITMIDMRITDTTLDEDSVGTLRIRFLPTTIRICEVTIRLIIPIATRTHVVITVTRTRAIIMTLITTNSTIGGTI
jgi:hypothetical protein